MPVTPPSEYPMTNPRATASQILCQVIDDHQSLTRALAAIPNNHPQTGLIKELCFGVCRWFFRLDAILQQLMAKPLRAKDHDIRWLLLIGLYQILYLRVPDHAAVLETVEAARALRKLWATKLINAVLRNFLRNQQGLLIKVDQSLAQRTAHPAWLVTAIQQAWPNEAEAILTANNQYPPLMLRVNCQKISRENYLQQLVDAGVTATALTDTTAGIVLTQAQDITRLPGFNDGYFSVQDVSAQWAATLLELAPDQRVLDACAAPGGKTSHILETVSDLQQLVVIDKEATRLEKVRENVNRLGLAQAPIQYAAVDAAQTSSWWDGQLFDRILLDAPCSGTGVIRRHPDIKILRQPEDIAEQAAEQQKLLEALWPLLKPNGILLYATCSILPAENQQQISQFLQQHNDAKEYAIVDASAIPGWQILPSEQGGDGFYYARLVKKL